MSESPGLADQRALVADDASRMTLAEHLIELRKRLLISMIAVAVGAVVGFLLWNRILDFMTAPLCRLPEAKQSLSGKCEVYAFDVLQPIAVRLRVAVFGGVLFSAPIWLYQLWAFIAPGLHRKERRWAFWFIATSFVLFMLGVAFAYFTLDKGLSFLLGIAGHRVRALPNVNSYFNFVSLMLLAFGVSFEFPIVLVILNIAGVLSTERMRSSRRMSAFLIALFAAVITPSQDPFTFTAMAVPMYAFFECAIIFGRLRDRAKRRRIANDPLAQLGDDETSVIDDRPSEIDDRPSDIDES
ncbi:MAG: twin-arginine translocase subunit TatC [Actinomycetota bacterium]